MMVTECASCGADVLEPARNLILTGEVDAEVFRRAVQRGWVPERLKRAVQPALDAEDAAWRWYVAVPEAAEDKVARYALWRVSVIALGKALQANRLVPSSESSDGPDTWLG